MSRVDNPMVRAVGRIPVTVAMKLLIAFASTAVLLVIIGLLGLQVIGDANQRVETLGELQQRATVYLALQTDAAELRQLLALGVGGPDTCAYTSCTPSAAGTSAPGSSPAPQVVNAESLASIDQVIISSPLANLTVNAGQVTSAPADETALLTAIDEDHTALVALMGQILTSDRAGAISEGPTPQRIQAEEAAEALRTHTASLVAAIQSKTDTLIADNGTSFADSQRLFIAVAAASIVLALLFGYLLSWSVIGPIRRMESRLTEISAGDFSSHVDVANRDELGALAANINHMNDELGRLYKELETASRHKSEFLANMSHELRTPLNAIIGFSQVLKERMFGELNPKQVEYVDDILGSGQHLLQLINDILDLSKVEAGRMELQPAVFSLPETLQTATVMVRERATRRGLSLTTEIDPSVGSVEADERKVKQILFNLLSNAVKFTPEGGRVSLAARGIGDEVEISVSDTGVGISPDDQTRIFEEFYQVGSANTQEGTGLGLALTRKLVELHHGRLTVESAPGSGSTFTFTLPRRQAEAAATMPAMAEGQATI